MNVKIIRVMVMLFICGSGPVTTVTATTTNGVTGSGPVTTGTTATATMSVTGSGPVTTGTTATATMSVTVASSKTLLSSVAGAMSTSVKPTTTTTGTVETSVEPDTPTAGSSSVAVTKTTTPKPITGCGSPGTFGNGTIQFSNSFLIGSVVKFICDDDFYINGTCNQTTTSLCLPNGKWRDDLPQCISNQSGVVLLISKNPFIEESIDNISITCNTSYELNDSTIKSLEIRRKLVASSAWETIATLNSTNITTAVSSSNLANKAIVSGRFNSGPVLMLTINESLLACEDATEYQCHVSFTDDHGQCFREINKQFNGLFFPKNVDLEVTMNGTVVESSNNTYAQLKAGDTIVLNCTAQIGNNANTIISWETSNPISAVELVPFTPTGTLLEESGGSYSNCQYTHSATITHTVNTFDFTEGNVSYSCHVEVTAPGGNTRHSAKANRVFHAEIYYVCPRPPSPAHGYVFITNTTVNSTAILKCDRGYKRSTGFATCKSSGKWDDSLRCDPVDCKNVTVPLNGHIIYSKSTSYNNTAEIVCDDEYHLNGSQSLVCEANGNWNSTNSSCVPTGCPKLPSLINGVITLSNSTHINSTASFKCYYGYKLAGNITSTCLDEGWDADVPSCDAIECPDPLAPTDGYVSFNTGWKEVNDTVIFSCYPGYKLVGSAETVCLLNATWQDESPSCSVKNCTFPLAPANGYVETKSGYAVNSTALIYCNEGYNLIGNDTIHCEENATWSILDTTCDLIDCKNVTEPLNGHIIYSKNTSYNNTAEIVCDDEYNLNGSQSLVCEANGDWSYTNSTCVPTGCPKLPSLINGIITLSNSTHINSTASFACYYGYKLMGNIISTCLDEGWDADVPSCDAIECPTPLSPTNGYVSFDTGKEVNDTVTFSCYPGYDLVGSAKTVCLLNATWQDNSPSCIVKNCTVPPSPTNGSVDTKSGYAVNSTALVYCNEGYNLIGNNTIHCEENATWSNLGAVCDLIDCGSPRTVYNHSQINVNGGTKVNGTGIIDCDLGYTLVGDGTILCLSNGSWSKWTGNCGLKQCPVTTFKHGALFMNSAQNYVNDIAFVKCDTGYVRQGSLNVMCTVNGTWDTSKTECIPKTCPPLPSLEYGMLSLNSSTKHVNDTATIHCNSGYVVDGLSSITCTVNGNWSEITTKCLPKNCTSPKAPANGTVRLNGGFSVHSSAVITCDEGFDLFGGNIITCLEDATWNGTDTNCSKKDRKDNTYSTNSECEILPPPENGFIVSGSNVFNSTMLFDCYQGYNLTGTSISTCLSDGNWSSTAPLCMPKECPELSELNHGRVNLTNNNLFPSYGTFSCKDGYNLDGFSATLCLASGNWTYPVPSCVPEECGNWTYSNVSWEAFSYVTYSEGTTFGSTAICYCYSGYQITSTAKSLAATCNATGSWSRASPPLCVAAECPSLNVTTNVKVEYSDDGKRSVDSTATFSCTKPGFRINGYTKVTCLPSGQWTGSSPTCKKIEESVTACSNDRDSHGLLWNETQPGAVATTKCQDKGYTGEISRQCSDKGVWKLPVYNCVRKDIDNIDKQIDAIKEHPSETVVTTALDQLINITKPSTKQTPMFGGEIEKVTSILESIANISEKIEVTDNQAEAFLKTTSNLLDTSNTESWKEISQEQDTTTNTETQNKDVSYFRKQQAKGATKIIDVVSRYTDAVAASLNNSKNASKTVSAPNLVLHVAKIEGNQNDISFPEQMDKHKYNLTSSFTIPKESLTGLKHVSSVLYKNLSGILPSTTISNGQKVKNQEINSAVVSVKIPSWQNNKKDFHINLKLGHLENQLNGPRCNFWNESLQVWDGTGCRLSSTSSHETICECNHLTNFAILMSPWKQENVDTTAIDIISIVGCSVSLLALVLTIVAHIALWRYVKSDRVVLLINLSVALVVSYAIFLGGVDRTENKDACTAVAVLLQYIYLVVFFIMLAEGIDIAVTVLYVFSTKSRLKWLIPCAWLIPAVIVGISLGATQLEGYGNEQFCWLSVKGGLIWAFVAPAFTIILVNFVLLILVLGAAFRTTTLAQKSRTEKTKTGVKCLCVLLPIMGCTWVIGIFYVNESMAWIQYVFAVCNSLQGLVIFLFHCAFNPQIRTAIQRRTKKYRDSNMLSSASISNSKQFSMPRASTQSSSYSGVEMNDILSREDAPFKRQSKRNSQTSRHSYEKVSGKWQDSVLEKYM